MNMSDRFVAKPLRLRNQVMHYDWGTRGDSAYIPRLLGTAPEPGTPYAELWMGVHPKAPSLVEVDSAAVPLDQLITLAPEAILGTDVAQRFAGGLPFLFKALSAGQSLSIQAHPNRAQAKALHERDPEHYADENHKPEIAIALGPVRLLAGFRPLADMVAQLDGAPELAGLLGCETVDSLRRASGSGVAAQREAVRAAVAQLLAASDDGDRLARALESTAQRLHGCDELSQAEALLLRLREEHPGADLGLYAPFLLNIVQLEPGQGHFTPAGVPHAYLSGDLIECMANSDNVVRLGLTSKFKDADALVEILDWTPRAPEVLRGASDGACRAYRTPAAEFAVKGCELAAGQGTIVDLAHAGVAILLITEGELRLRWEGGCQRGHRGDALLLPACVGQVELSTRGGAVWYAASVPGGERAN